MEQNMVQLDRSVVQKPALRCAHLSPLQRCLMNSVVITPMAISGDGLRQRYQSWPKSGEHNVLSGGFPATLAGAAVLAAETVPGYESLLLSVILSLKVTVIGENVTSTLLLYNKRPPNVFITSKNKKNPHRFMADVRRRTFKTINLPLLCFLQLLFVGKMKRMSGEKMKSRVA